MAQAHQPQARRRAARNFHKGGPRTVADLNRLDVPSWTLDEDEERDAYRAAGAPVTAEYRE